MEEIENEYRFNYLDHQIEIHKKYPERKNLGYFFMIRNHTDQIIHVSSNIYDLKEQAIKDSKVFLEEYLQQNFME